VSMKHWNKRMNDVKEIVQKRIQEFADFWDSEPDKMYKERYFFDHLDLCEECILEDIDKLSEKNET